MLDKLAWWHMCWKRSNSITESSTERGHVIDTHLAWPGCENSATAAAIPLAWLYATWRTQCRMDPQCSPRSFMTGLNPRKTNPTGHIVYSCEKSGIDYT